MYMIHRIRNFRQIIINNICVIGLFNNKWYKNRIPKIFCPFIVPSTPLRKRNQIINGLTILRNLMGMV